MASDSFWVGIFHPSLIITSSQLTKAASWDFNHFLLPGLLPLLLPDQVQFQGHVSNMLSWFSQGAVLCHGVSWLSIILPCRAGPLAFPTAVPGGAMVLSLPIVPARCRSHVSVRGEGRTSPHVPRRWRRQGPASGRLRPGQEEGRAPPGSSQSLWLARRQVYSALQWIQFVVATLSVIGSSSLIAYAVFQNEVRSPEVRPLFYLSLSDLFLGMCWLIGALLYTTPTTNQDVVCYNLQTTGQVLDYANFIGRIATILSSLIPFLLMVPVFCVGNSRECYQNFSQKHGCLLMHTETVMLTGQLQNHGSAVCAVMYFYGIGVFLVAFFISFIAIMVLLVKARALYKRFINATGFLGDQQWAMIKIVEQRVVFYPIAFFCCWGPAVLLGILKLIVSVDSRIYVALYILQALTAASQGLLNCIVYGWTQHMFRRMKRKACRDVDTQTPLLRSQKKHYASTAPTSPPAAAVATSTVL
ncbi:transmembrane protein 116 isoform X2 [Carettochelys insculpta]|uniref:transmembrane protein 116 isoform X2 n=1 Tax=Carettochelys insculpta TaxID=44489 RepID=UPI003EB72A45